jgi:Type IV pili methyl-accepting chemotaxis transducer N-term
MKVINYFTTCLCLLLGLNGFSQQQIKVIPQTSSAPSTLSIGASINIAGKQRMLTQRMAKTFMYIGMNINTEAATRERISSVILFEENLKALMAFAPTPKIKAAFQKEEQLWLEYKKLINAETTKANALLILDSNTTILTVCDEAVQACVEYASTVKKENESGISAGTIAENINTSGRQRMISQRLTFYYAAYVWGIAEPATSLRLKNLAEFLQENFSRLITSEVNNTEIDDAIAGVIGDWREIEERCVKDNCYTFENKSVDVGQMYKFSGTVLSKMDKITALYAKLLE